MCVSNDALKRALIFRWACEHAISHQEVKVPREIAPAVVTLAGKIVKEATEVFMQDFLDEIPVFVDDAGVLCVANRKLDLQLIKSTTFKMCDVDWSKDAAKMMHWVKETIGNAGCNWFEPQAVIVVDWLVPGETKSFVIKFFWDGEPEEN